MRNYTVLLLLTLLLGSCGIFQPRDTFEIPELKLPVDRFNFSAILEGKRFTWQSYETFFCDTLHYTYHNSRVYDKKNLIDHLQQLEHQYRIFSIEWSDITSYEEGNVLNITKATYRVVVKDTTLGGGEVFTGTSTMVIVRDGVYKVATWDDFPDGEQKPFFAPLD